MVIRISNVSILFVSFFSLIECHLPRGPNRTLSLLPPSPAGVREDGGWLVAAHVGRAARRHLVQVGRVEAARGHLVVDGLVAAQAQPRHRLGRRELHDQPAHVPAEHRRQREAAVVPGGKPAHRRVGTGRRVGPGDTL